MSHCECGDGEEERDEGIRQRGGGGGGGGEAEKLLWDEDLDNTSFLNGISGPVFIKQLKVNYWTSKPSLLLP